MYLAYQVQSCIHACYMPPLPHARTHARTHTRTHARHHLTRIRMRVPPESTTVRFVLNNRSFSIWDVATHSWSVQKGTFGVHVGASSRDLRASATIVV